MLNQKILACIQCGAHLLELKCKLRCPRCGYFEDCLRSGTASLCSDGGTNVAQEMDLGLSINEPQTVVSNKPANPSRFPYSI